MTLLLVWGTMSCLELKDVGLKPDIYYCDFKRVFGKEPVIGS